MFDELISYAEYKLNESVTQREDVTTIRYWAGYADGLRAAKREMEKVADMRGDIT